MKFEIDNVKQYAGEDLIFLVACPGARFSSTYNFISLNSAINTTDQSDENTYHMTVKHVNGKLLNIGNHRGTYWGPYHQYGHRFDRLFELSKTEILEEFMGPFDNWDKIKVIKSHWFAYHLEYLHNLFPKAKVVSCYANDIDSFYRWHKCGGWGITYPKYVWYEDDTRMLEKIKEENYRLLKFNKDRDVSFNLLKVSEFHEKLGLPSEIKESEDVSLKCEVAIYDGSYLSNFNHLTR